MRYSTQVKPISYLKAHAAEVLAHLVQEREPVVITQNGEAKAVLQDVVSYENTQETLALLKILAMGNQEMDAGLVKPVSEVVSRLRSKTPFSSNGSHPRELLALGIKTYRQTHFKPYRVIYRVAGSRVIIHLIADGRRHMSSLLQQRLLGQ